MWVTWTLALGLQEQQGYGCAPFLSSEKACGGKGKGNKIAEEEEIPLDTEISASWVWMNAGVSQNFVTMNQWINNSCWDKEDVGKIGLSDVP